MNSKFRTPFSSLLNNLYSLKVLPSNWWVLREEAKIFVIFLKLTYFFYISLKKNLILSLQHINLFNFHFDFTLLQIKTIVIIFNNIVFHYVYIYIKKLYFSSILVFYLSKQGGRFFPSFPFPNRKRLECI